MWTLVPHLLTQLQTWVTWGTALKAFNVLIVTGEIKTGTLSMNFHKSAVKENPYVQFGYVALKSYNNTQGKVSESMNADTINMIQTSQQPT